MPFKDRDDAVSAVFADSEAQIAKILSSYVDLEGRPIRNCIIATIPSKGGNLALGDWEAVDWAISLLFLSAFATNDYFRNAGSYVASSNFRVMWQAFTDEVSWISPVWRRRDGHTQSGGYEHGKVKFVKPLQCTLNDPAMIDQRFLEALDLAVRAGTETTGRLRKAVSFVVLANSDDDVVDVPVEAILMASAFEQMLDVEYKRELVLEFEKLFSPYGSVSVAQAMGGARPDIRIDQDPARAASQPKWFIHKKWVEELYDLRSATVHDGTHGGRAWGWSFGEHLVMAAYVFPLLIKLMLERDGMYALSEQDGIRCLTVDRLLEVAGWSDVDGADQNRQSKWDRIVDAVRREVASRRMERTIEDSIRAAEDAGGGQETLG